MYVLSPARKSASWHTALRLRKKSEKKDKDGKREGKLENGYRKSREGLSTKVSVKVRVPLGRGRGGVLASAGHTCPHCPANPACTPAPRQDTWRSQGKWPAVTQTTNKPCSGFRLLLWAARRTLLGQVHCDCSALPW